jgi:hypothetical protein
MPMIDVYATAGTFTHKHQLAADLATAVMTIEQVPDIPMFRQNTGLTAAALLLALIDRHRGRRARDETV